MNAQDRLNRIIEMCKNRQISNPFYDVGNAIEDPFHPTWILVTDVLNLADETIEKKYDT